MNKSQKQISSLITFSLITFVLPHYAEGALQKSTRAATQLTSLMSKPPIRSLLHIRRCEALQASTYDSSGKRFQKQLSPFIASLIALSMLHNNEDMKPQDKALYEAVKKFDKDEVKRLLQAGANPNMQNKGGVTPLHEAAYHGMKELVELLINKGAHKDAVDRNNTTALHLAARNGHLPVVELLLQAGASKNVQDNRGLTPLQEAIRKGHKAVVAVLEKADADEGMERGGPLSPAERIVYMKKWMINNQGLSHWPPASD